MAKLRAAIAFGLSVLLMGAASPDVTQVTIAPKGTRADVFPIVEASFPGGIVARPHVEYANLVGYRPLQLDLYLHTDRASAAPRPLVVWIHGGGWNRGDGRGSGAFANYPAVLAMLAARGYVVASVDYRLSGEAPFPAQIQDVKAAIRFLRDHAADYGIDPARVMLWGGSAGGHLASLAATSCGVAAFAPAPSAGRMSHAEMAAAKPSTASDCVQAAAIWYGVFDLSPHVLPGTRTDELNNSDGIATQLLGCDPKTCAAKAIAASPIHYLSAKTPPMLLVHGMADTTVSYHQSERMADALRKAGVPVETLFIPGLNHGLISKDADQTRAATLQALQRTFEFFDAKAGLHS